MQGKKYPVEAQKQLYKQKGEPPTGYSERLAAKPYESHSTRTTLPADSICYAVNTHYLDNRLAFIKYSSHPKCINMHLRRSSAQYFVCIFPVTHHHSYCFY